MSKLLATTLIAVAITWRFPVSGKEASKTATYPAIVGFWTLNTNLSEVVTRGGVQAWAHRLDRAGVDPLMCELSEPPAYLTIVPGEGVITFVDGEGVSRTFGTSGEPEPHRFAAGTVEATTRWKGGELRQELSLPGGLQIIRRFAAAGDADHLIVTIEAKTSGHGQMQPLRRVYVSDVVR